MEKLSAEDRTRLAKALADGGIKHVTYGNRAEAEGALSEFRQLERLCAVGYLRLHRISESRHASQGEQAYEYQLTEKGRGATGVA